MVENAKIKILNCWNYHKVKILIVFLATIIVGYAVHLIYVEEPATVLYGEFVNLEISQEVEDELGKRMLEYIGLDKQSRILLGKGMYIDVEHPENNVLTGVLENLTVQIFSHELDFIICPRIIMDYYSDRGALIQMENGTYGLRVDFSKLELEIEYNGEIYFCIFKNSERKENARLVADIFNGEEAKK